jgi:hypothetical protein
MSWNDSGNTATIINSTITGNDGGARSTVGGGLLAADGGNDFSRELDRRGEHRGQPECRNSVKLRYIRIDSGNPQFARLEPRERHGLRLHIDRRSSEHGSRIPVGHFGLRGEHEHFRAEGDQSGRRRDPRRLA